MSVLDLIAACERKQRENFDIQQSLIDDPPVMIPAFRSAVEQLVARDPHKVEVAGSSPARALLPVSTHSPGGAGINGAAPAPGSSFHDNADSSQSSGRARELSADRSLT